MEKFATEELVGTILAQLSKVPRNLESSDVPDVPPVRSLLSQADGTSFGMHDADRPNL